MATSYTNEIKHGAKEFTIDDLGLLTFDTPITEDGKTLGEHTFDELQAQSYTNETKNSASYTNETKN